MQINKVSIACFKAGVKPQNIAKKMDNPMEKFIKEEGAHLHDFYSQTELNNMPVSRILAPQYYADQAKIASLRFTREVSPQIDNPMKKFVQETDSMHEYRSASMEM